MKLRLAQLAATSPRELAQFRAAFPRPALLFDPYVESSGTERDTDTASMPIIHGRPIEQQALADTIAVFLVKRQGTTGFQDVVTLGRAPTQDVSLPLPSVSKFHACFAPYAPGSPHWKITDMGATNGTFVDGVKLSRNADARLENGKRLGFGAATAVFVTPDGLHGLLAELRR